MSQRDNSDTSCGSLDSFSDILHCFICKEAACGVGPFSRRRLCRQHLAIDMADGQKLVCNVNEEVHPLSESASAKVAALLEEQKELSGKLSELEERFSALLLSLTECKARVVSKLRAQQEAVATCLRDFEKVACYSREVRRAEAVGDMASVCNLALSMQLSVPNIKAQFKRAAHARAESETALKQSLHGLWKLQQTIADWWVDSVAGQTDSGDSERPETTDAATKVKSISLSHEVKLDSRVGWLSVCTDTSKFRGDPTGRVIPAESAGAGAGSVPLPQPCLVAAVDGKDHLTILSVDGSVMMRCHCSDINWKDWITGLHGDRHLVFIAQAAAVTVTDLSGRVIHEIHPDTAGFCSIAGITGNAASVFVSSGNKIAQISKATGELETVITLSQLSHADLDNLVIHGNHLLVTDWKHYQVYRVHIDTQQVVATHPTPRTGLAQFEGLADVAIDSRGRLFVSEFLGHTVRIVAADDGSLLWTLGVPGVSGSGVGRLNGPCGLTVVTGGPCEQLVVSDGGNHRLLVLNLL